MTGGGMRQVNPFQRLAAVLSAAFAMTVLALCAGVFGDPRAPVQKLLDRYGGHVLMVEVAGIVLCGVLGIWRESGGRRVIQEPDGSAIRGAEPGSARAAPVPAGGQNQPE